MFQIECFAFIQKCSDSIEDSLKVLEAKLQNLANAPFRKYMLVSTWNKSVRQIILSNACAIEVLIISFDLSIKINC